ncbi:hypothetical protein JCM3765_007133 [Sporobolomyces pararoseus]
MFRLIDLPPELLIKIIEELRTDLYTAKERQTDLARVAQIHPLTNEIARSMLYGGEVTARSAGRTHLLARSLICNPRISEFIRTLSFKSEMDSGHVESLIKILQICSNLENLSLSAVYLKSAPCDLYTSLQSHSQLRSFSYGFYGVESPLETIVPLLNSFLNLKHLNLDRIAAIPPGRSPNSSQVKRDLRRWGPPPTYSLESISITNWRSFDTAGWPLEIFDWLFGSTKSSLRSFQLVDFVGATPLQSVCDFLVDRMSNSFLERLTIRDYQDGLSLEPEPLDPNSLVATFPNLTQLSLMTNADESSFTTPTPHLLLPPQLRFLQLDDDLFLTWRLLEMVQAESVPTSLKRIRLRGPFPSDGDVKALKRACGAKGIECEVVRAF